MPDLAQRYAHAATSSNLKCDQYHADADVLMAVAMSGGLAASLARVKYLRDASAYRALLTAWRGVVSHKARLRKWPADTNVQAIAKISLDYWLTDQCPDCDGTGFPMHPSIPTRDSRPCRTCSGSGRRPLSCPRQHRELALDLYGELGDAFDKATVRAKRKLRN